MNNYRVGYTHEGRCSAKYKTARTHASAIFQVLEEFPEAKHCKAVEVPSGVINDKKWAESRK